MPFLGGGGQVEFFVIEVNRGDRRSRPSNGKSDTLDAEAAARATLGGQAFATPKSADGTAEMIRQVKIARAPTPSDDSLPWGPTEAELAQAQDIVRFDVSARADRSTLPAELREFGFTWCPRRSPT